jgi:glycosyltransferase involved in cell wall biosynthesis
VKILLLHNAYKHRGGEDNVLEAEYNLLNSKRDTCYKYIVSNKTISTLPEKIKTGFNCSYSRVYEQIVLEKIKTILPDIVHVHNFFPLLTPSIYDACIKTKTPVIQTLHNYRTICPGALLMRKGHICEKCISGSLYNAVIHKCYRGSILESFAVAKFVKMHRKNKTWQKKVNYFIALTEFAKRKFIQAGFPSEKIVVKPNFYAQKKELVCRPQDRKGALFVGRLSSEKGIETLLKAWKNLKIPLRIAGDGPFFGKISLNENPFVKSLGRLTQEQISVEMGKASFLIMPSEWYEGFPMVLVEAFAHALPVLTSRLGGMAEIVEHKRTGIHFKAGDENELAEKALWMYKHPEKTRIMGENALIVYNRKYTPENNYNQLNKIYQKAIFEYQKS